MVKVGRFSGFGWSGRPLEQPANRSAAELNKLTPAAPSSSSAPTPEPAATSAAATDLSPARSFLLEMSLGTFEQLTQGGNTLVSADAFKRATKAVCRITTPTGSGTGFLISSSLIMTNHHVLPNKWDAEKSYAEFCLSKKTIKVWLNPERFFTCSPAPQDHKDVDPDHLDYAVVAAKITPDAVDISKCPLAFFESNQVVPKLAFIIQHPQGGPKQYALGGNKITQTTDLILRYKTETDYGSSGSPVLCPSGGELKVVGLHHRRVPGQNLNQGVAAKAIWTDLKKKHPQLGPITAARDLSLWKRFKSLLISSTEAQPATRGVAQMAQARQGTHCQLAIWLVVPFLCTYIAIWLIHFATTNESDSPGTR